MFLNDRLKVLMLLNPHSKAISVSITKPSMVLAGASMNLVQNRRFLSVKLLALEYPALTLVPSTIFPFDTHSGLHLLLLLK
jgi:hypothetical protein